jgi:hypothetical protein
VLIPDVARGAAVELAELRSACRSAIRRVAPAGTPIVVIGAGPAAASYQPSARGSLAGFGVDLEVTLGSDDSGPVEMPLSLTVGAWLLREALGPNCGAIGYALGPDDIELALPEGDLALVVMGDGSARRSTSAPGYLDERAEGFDAEVADALRSGEAARLHVDRRLGAELLAAGAPVWDTVAASLAESRWDAELLYDRAPYGVGYFVAAWTARG